MELNYLGLHPLRTSPRKCKLTPPMSQTAKSRHRQNSGCRKEAATEKQTYTPAVIINHVENRHRQNSNNSYFYLRVRPIGYRYKLVFNIFNKFSTSELLKTIFDKSGIPTISIIPIILLYINTH